VATKPHGLRGAIHVDVDPSARDTIRPDSRVRLARAASSQEFRVTDVRPVRGGLLLVLDGIGDRTTAQRWAGADVFVDRESLLRDADTYFDFELVGLEVVARDGAPLGRITEVIGTGANDVLVVDGERGEVLIPAITNAVLHVDIRAGRVTVDERVMVTGGDDSSRS
jgi:16S rRNA processing protein RimM